MAKKKTVLGFLRIYIEVILEALLLSFIASHCCSLVGNCIIKSIDRFSQIQTMSILLGLIVTIAVFLIAFPALMRRRTGKGLGLNLREYLSQKNEAGCSATGTEQTNKPEISNADNRTKSGLLGFFKHNYKSVKCTVLSLLSLLMIYLWFVQYNIAQLKFGGSALFQTNYDKTKPINEVILWEVFCYLGIYLIVFLILFIPLVLIFNRVNRIQNSQESDSL